MSGPSLEPLRTTSTFRVRYAETDRMGVVYHAHYLVWCEVGRTDFIRRLGASYAELEDSGLGLVVVDVRVRYLDAARYDDVVRVDTWLERVRSRTVTFAYEIRRNEEPGQAAPIVTASTRLMATDEAGSPRTLPGDLLQRLRAAAS